MNSMLYIDISHFTVSIGSNRFPPVRILAPILEFAHCEIFKTACMNNFVDLVSRFTSDVVVFVMYGILWTGIVIPQAVWFGGYFVATGIYHLAGDLDEFLLSKNFSSDATNN